MAAAAIILALGAAPARAYTTATLSATALNFGAQQTGTTSVQSVTLTATGLDALIVSAAATSDPAEFTVQNNTCPAGGVASQGTCAIAVTFTPQAAGTRSATFTITSNADTSPQIVNLTGTGTAPGDTTVSVTPTSVDFSSVAVGSSAQTSIKVSDASRTYSLYISGASPSDAADFGIAQNGCPTGGGAVGALGSCSIEVDFAPQSVANPINGTLTITDNTTGGSTAVGLSGIGTAPTSLPVSLSTTALNFGSVVEGNTAPNQTVTITNNQTNALNISSLYLMNAANFGFVSADCGLTLAAGGSIAACAPPNACPACTVRLSFAPPAVGAQNGTLAFLDDASTSPQIVNLSGTGTAPPTTADTAVPSPLSFTAATGYSAQQNLTVTDTGSNPLYISNLALSDNSNFGIVSNGCPMAPASLAANSNCIIAVDFAPQSSGTINGTLTIADNNSAGSDTVNLSGTTTACPIGQPWGPSPPAANPRVFYSGQPRNSRLPRKFRSIPT